MATKGTVSGVIANMVTLTVDGPVAQNEICYILTLSLIHISEPTRPY